MTFSPYPVFPDELGTSVYQDVSFRHKGKAMLLLLKSLSGALAELPEAGEKQHF